NFRVSASLRATWESRAWSRARSTPVRRAAAARRSYACLRSRRSSGVSPGLQGGSVIPGSVCERPDRHVHAHRVPTRREELEEIEILTFPLPAVGDVRVVAHENEQPAVLVEYPPHLGLAA